MNFCASPDGIYIWVSVIPPQPKEAQYSSYFFKC